MNEHELAGKPAPKSILTDIPALIRAYYTSRPNPSDPKQLVSFGTSGHRGCSFQTTFNEDHILAIVQSICDYRSEAGITGPLFIGKDTHALSEAAFATAVEVLAANAVEIRVDKDGYTPTPVISHAIREYNKKCNGPQADGIIITPSHNPPQDGGIKYNPPHGGPADVDITDAIANRANLYLALALDGVEQVPFDFAIKAGTTKQHDYKTPYVEQLSEIINIEAIRSAKIRIVADALGGAGLKYYETIRERYGLDMECLNTCPDPTFSFMTVDHDGKIRMDCSSRYAMKGLFDRLEGAAYQIAVGNDPDFDRHGIVTPSGGLMNPNHYLSVAIDYLFKNRPQWLATAAIGKTMVSSTMINRVADSLGRKVNEVPVGFKWFVPGLKGDGADDLIGFGGEESAGASFRRRDGSSWTTDKDGMILALLAAEITAVTGRDPSQYYNELEEKFGSFYYDRIDNKTDDATSDKLKNITPEKITAATLAGDPITKKLISAPGNGAALGGIKVETDYGWFAVRPSGTEAKYKIYAESYRSEDHLKTIQSEAEKIIRELQ
jgi:phosphoglucomutase